MAKITYPHTSTVPQVDDYHGIQVPDPYRWLEETDSPETKAWIEAQNALTFGFLEQIPARQHLRQRLKELWDFPKAWAPVRRGKHYFQLRNTGLQNQNVLYVMEGPGEVGRVLLDPNTLSEDGTVALSDWSPSADGRYLAYATSASGSDWLTWRVREVGSGEDLPDLVEWSKFSGAAWRVDGSGFYYARYDALAAGQGYTGTNYYHKLYFHRLGDAQEHDRLVYERPDQKEWGFEAAVSDDDHYLVLTVWQGTEVRNRLFYQDLERDGPVVELIPDLEAEYVFLGNDGPLLYLRTNLNTPLGSVIAVDITRPEKEHWRTIIPQTGDTLEAAIMVHDQFVALYLHDAYHQLKRFDLQGNPLEDIPLPGIGSIVSEGNFLNLTGKRQHDELFYAYWAFTTPVTVFRCGFSGRSAEGEVSELVFQPPLDFDASPYITRQVFASSKDGTRVPMFLTHRRDLKPDGSNPTLLYGYGGFNLALKPGFMVSRLAWLEMGGVLALANLRGGKEYGEAWHQAGMLDNKQNVFDDFIACAEYLVAENITSTPKLAIMGGSNGGLLVGACMTQRPDLFGAAIPSVGVMDMLRFHKFTIGWAWVSDYGSPEDPDQFKTLYAYSPLHNLKPGTQYPPTLVVTADHDDRVVPGHSFKYAAALQAAQGGEAPVLIRIQTRAGHGQGKPTAIQIEEIADIWAYLVDVLGIGQ
ncbi:MAG TPA: prolyl oligopeptidase family serine peptidase [Anaerolineales bacterium]|nr:prolyl oligopeptidase family serine peptidase [Anaerolineales bacterium]